MVDLADPRFVPQDGITPREMARGMPPAPVDEDAKQLMAQWRTRLDQAWNHDEYARKRYIDDRRVARGDTEWLVDTNLVGAILEILESFVYAKDPEFEVRVSESVNNSRGKMLGEFTETARIVVSRLLRDAGFKRQGRRWVRAAQTVGAGWLKPSLSTRTLRDPIVESQINSLQENLKRLEVLEANLAEGEVGDEEAARAEIAANITALEAKLEREVPNGLALDLFAADDVQVSPECGELANYLQAPWIRFRTYKSKVEAQAITGWNADTIGKANVYTQRLRTGNEQSGLSGGSEQQAWIRTTDASAQTADGFVAIEEIWSKRDGVVYTMIDGITDQWARAPFAPLTGSRFYDGFLLGFHYIDGERHPQSDVFQLKKLQDEYGRTRSNFAEHRKRAVPYTIWDAGEVPAPEMDKINSAEALENIAVNFATPGTPIQNKYFRVPSTQIDPAMYTTQPITTDMEKVSGAQDAMQSGVSIEKTATEAQIQNTGFTARIGGRRDEFETVLSEIGLFVLQLALQGLPEEEVVKIAGTEAVWPKLSVDEVMSAFDVEVRAGSTGKPNLQADRNAWSTLLPLVEKMITVIGNFRSQGPQMEWAAAPYVEMLTTTFLLLGNKDDVEKYLPHPPPPAPPDPLAGIVAALGGGQGESPPSPGLAGPMAPIMDAIGTPSGTPAPTGI